MNTVNHEYYVSLEVAKLLEKAGFDWECKGVYNKGKLCAWYEPKSNDWWKCQSDTYAAPTLEVAQRWLREVKEVDVIVTYEAVVNKKTDAYEKKYAVVIYDAFINKDADYHDTYEEALETGIKKVLEIILEKGE